MPFGISPVHNVFFKKLKEKGLKEAFRRALHHIAQDPYAGERKTGDLAGLYGYGCLLQQDQL